MLYFWHSENPHYLEFFLFICTFSRKTVKIMQFLNKLQDNLRTSLTMFHNPAGSRGLTGLNKETNSGWSLLAFVACIHSLRQCVSKKGDGVTKLQAFTKHELFIIHGSIFFSFMLRLYPKEVILLNTNIIYLSLSFDWK